VTLHIAAPGTDDKRGILQGAGVACPTTESQKDCNDVMRKDLEQWLIDHGISGRGRRWREWENSVRPIESNWYIYNYIYTDCTISVWKELLIVETSWNNCLNLPANPEGPPPSPEVEQRAMWQWIRDFHKDSDCFGWSGLFSLISIFGSQDMSRGFKRTILYTVLAPLEGVPTRFLKYRGSWQTLALNTSSHFESLALPGVQWRLVHSEHAPLARSIQANLRAGDEENAWARSGFEEDVCCVTVSVDS